MLVIFRHMRALGANSYCVRSQLFDARSLRLETDVIGSLLLLHQLILIWHRPELG
jgi:hypothetical protein